MTDDPRPSAVDGLPLASLVPGASGVLTGVTLDSRRVRPGDLYVGLPGASTHGARFADAAAAAGALAVLTDAEGASLAAGSGLPVAVVEDPRVAMADVAATVYGRPGDRVELFGVTGTNGKTSTVFLLDAALTALGRTVATIGTIGYRLAGAPVESSRSTITTPESPDLQALLGVLVEGGADTVAMEVSSHALALHRADGMVFDAAAFTMLGQDHLEFHHTMEEYFSAKAKLFTGGRTRAAVVNTADDWGRRLAAMVAAEGAATLVTTLGEDADYRVRWAEPLPAGGSRVLLDHPGGEVEFTLSMLGEFNVANAVTALALIGATGGDVRAAARGLADAHVPGRMQRVDLGEGRPHVVVDFAHTPQAVAAALNALPATGRRIAVLGAGGDRDPSKRGPMGRAAARGADVVIVTDDNPRSEVPGTIRASVLEGARGRGAEVVDGGDRRSAIARALAMAGPDDWVAVLGKGHETGQDVGGTVSPFDDVAVVRELGGQ
ncbi:UDP-N-acetylmuramoyl-L-alanyl-D-glutamate--2,6-diaminopimelate ligase [Propioniciclava coleopterorum]|uniref:UDP-N-acetylmuramoyl-L-alanyl-D-glutamate--2,6-diaminopimelate ligase n=1 Tax=Propioniciclava coleopterorum TaxID=2714937 RepID=A0A6G7Y843_9ACTN|nr:UDP-N-acetylmuramoyl-L-alanyl-D-glutamate--2,6-diaminopimelate ligase [Propioniciclava coleopterorum]QIK72963.1 UDP-N-acetylmuramoyl-L-alanyl-D-glutamate--2,6-diaminopimelate ligase [Propioniciclava coleopterorum]